MIPKKPIDVTWTDDQWSAIYEDNKNIIVSAGAGSGKTAVLTERVIRKLKDGVNINELLILTFTKAAAGEMADRIRKKIKKIPELSNQLNLIDSAYITTFDSFALSIVKRYHYILNLSQNISIIDPSIINLEKEKIMDNLFLEYYQKREPKFLDMIKTFCIKDDKEIRDYFLDISNKLDLLSNKKEYLENYININFNNDKIEEDINKYYNLIKDYIEEIKLKVDDISLYDNEFASAMTDSLLLLYENNNYNDLVERLNINLPRVPRGSEEEVKNIKAEINDIIKKIKELAIYSNTDEIKESIISTRPIIEVMIDIILEFTNRVEEYKKKYNSFEFNDIAIMAINILKDNIDIREYLKEYFKEIMIDEYQDTNDLQEEFISMISNNNVYMVGDIKQSIYRFRNANPYIFKNKYDTYSKSNIDLKIDLKQNFRSRSEVINNINLIFNIIMNDSIGGADYITSHQMIFGNNTYNKEKTNHSNNMDIITYNYDKESIYTKEEIEAFYIAKDIKDKYNNKYQVLDKDKSILRDIKYTDFSIIIDRSSSFTLYKKIFNYFKIPLTILKDEKMNEEDDIHIINNLIKLIILINNNDYTTNFKYLFTSIMKSFLYEETDNNILDYFINNNFKDSNLYQTCYKISKKIDYITPHELLDIIITNFDYYNKYIHIRNIRGGITKISKLKELSINLENLGYTIYTFSEHLDNLLEQDYNIEYSINNNNNDSVSIMTIHKSKGLEYPICYFSGLYKSFNISDLNQRFIYDKNIGIISPYFNEGISSTIYKELLRKNYIIEEISEKIRLFYVALTRAREKIILIKPSNEKITNTTINDIIKSKYRSLDDILNSIENNIKDYYINMNIEDLNLTKDYNIIKKTNYKDNINTIKDNLKVTNINITNQEITNNTFSKKTNELITKDTYNNLELGTRIHEYLEYLELKNPNINIIDEEYIKEIIKSFLNNKLLNNIKEANIYQEYEFIYEEENNEYHGIIDLMLEYPDHIDIIDYKLKNINDDNYKKQLSGYKEYISKVSNKKINTYLYSLMNKELLEVL